MEKTEKPKVVPVADRAGLTLWDEVPKVGDILKEGVGLFVMHEGEALTGFQRQMYMSGLIGIEVNSEGHAERAYGLHPPVEPEEAEPVAEPVKVTAAKSAR